MEKLKTEFKKSQHRFVQLDRTDTTAIYLKYLTLDKTQVPSSYEVFKVKIKGEWELNGYKYPEAELYPSNEEFGRTAFSFKDKMKAFECYEEMKSGTDKIKENFLIVGEYKLRYYPEKSVCIITKDGKPIKDPKSIIVGIYAGMYNKEVEEIEDMTIKNLTKGIFDFETI